MGVFNEELEAAYKALPRKDYQEGRGDVLPTNTFGPLVHRDSGLKDSGARTSSVTGGLRETDNPERGFYELVPPGPLKRLAVHYARGAVKYLPRNWEKGIETGRTFRSMLRHAFSYLAGDRSEDHLAAIAWNAFALMDHEDRLKAGTLPRELDTLPLLKEVA